MSVCVDPLTGQLSSFNDGAARAIAQAGDDALLAGMRSVGDLERVSRVAAARAAIGGRSLADLLGGRLSLAITSLDRPVTSAGDPCQDGQRVAAWTGPEAGGSFTQATDSRRPIYVERAMGGMPGLLFDGAANLGMAHRAALDPGSGEFRVFLIARVSSRTSQTLMSKGNHTSAVAGWSLFHDNAHTNDALCFRALGASSAGRVVFRPNWDWRRLSMYECGLSGGAVSLLLGGDATGVLAGTPSAGAAVGTDAYTGSVANTGASLTIGSNSANAAFAKETIFAIVVVQGAMTATEAAQVREYLRCLFAPSPQGWGHVEAVREFRRRAQPFSASAITAVLAGAVAVRIPALKIVGERTHVACEARPDANSDEGEIGIVHRFSDNRGDAWSPPQVLASGSGMNYRNPCLGVTATGRLVLLFNSRPSGTNEGEMNAGFTTECMRAYRRFSDDGGLTWSPIVEITEQVRPPGYLYHCFGPSSIVTLPSGRLVVALNGSAPGRFGIVAPTDLWILYSDDHGLTWQRGARSNRTPLVQGVGYTSAPTLVITGGGGSGATAVPIMVGNVPVGATVTNGGNGYGATLVINGSGAGATALALVNNGQIVKCPVVTQGLNYSSGPSAIVTGGGGTGLRIRFTVAGGVITQAQVANQGIGYTSPPTITVTDPTGAGAAITATVAGGVVTGLTVVNGGGLYSQPTTVSVASGSGTGFAADVVVDANGRVTEIKPYNYGSGYSPLAVSTGGGATTQAQWGVGVDNATGQVTSVQLAGWGDNEATLAASSDGTLFVSIRDSAGPTNRYWATSSDGGLTLQNYGPRPDLWTNACQGGLCVGRSGGREVLFAVHQGNPLATGNPARNRLSVYGTFNRGGDWPAASVVVNSAAGYALLDVYPDGTIAMIQEAGSPVSALEFATMRPNYPAFPA